MNRNQRHQLQLQWAIPRQILTINEAFVILYRWDDKHQSITTMSKMPPSQIWLERFLKKPFDAK